MTPQRFALLVLAREKAEADMRRAFKRWEKYRAKEARAAKSLEQDFRRRADDIAGKIDWRKLDS